MPAQVAFTSGSGIADSGDAPGIAPDRQALFEGAVLAVLAHVLDTGCRIDLAVNDYLARFPIDGDGSHVRPDLIICVSDCQILLLRDQPDAAAARLSLDDATRAWRDARASERLDSDRSITRVQACIGNIRRAIGAACV